MNSSSYNEKLALSLLNISMLTTIQLKHDGKFPIPQGYKLIKAFKARALPSSREEWFGFILETKDSIVIAFRGSDTFADWLADSKVAQTPYYGGNVHRGFLFVYQSCQKEIMSNYNNMSQDKALYITGHSLGAALATLHALDAANKMNFKNIVMYNFASPRVGDPTFASIYNSKLSNSVRFVNTYDEIPKLPQTQVRRRRRTWRYEHVDHEVDFTLKDHHYDVVYNHSFHAYREGIKQLNGS